RITLHQHPVLVRAGLRLVAVDDEVAGPYARGRESPLHTGREARAAAPEEACCFDLVAHLLRRLAQRGAQAFVSPGGEEALERVAVVEPETSRDDRLGVGDHRPSMGR